MKLSEAIRLGAMLRPQGFGEFFPVDHGVDTTTTRSCAMGAACEAVSGTVTTPRRVMEAANKEWPWLKTGTVSCPEIGCRRPTSGTCTDIIIHLNDCHEWTREKIAAWVETVEPFTVVAKGVRETAAV